MPLSYLRGIFERCLAESNRCSRFCRPVPNRSAKAPFPFWECKYTQYFWNYNIFYDSLLNNIHDTAYILLNVKSAVPLHEVVQRDHTGLSQQLVICFSVINYVVIKRLPRVSEEVSSLFIPHG